MCKTLIALAALSAAALPTTAAAADRALHAHQVTAAGAVVGLADAGTLAYGTDFHDLHQVTLRSDDGRSRAVAAAEGCDISAAGSGLLAGECGAQSDVGQQATFDLMVQRLDGTLVTRLSATVRADNANGFSPGGPVAVGSQWIGLTNGTKDGDPWTSAVNWHSGETRESYQTDARRLDDFDAPALGVPLCAPLRRVRRESPSVVPSFLAATVVGRYVLLQTDYGQGELRRCGAAKPVSLPKGFVPQALGAGWVVGRTKVAHAAPRLDLVRLADRRRFVVDGLPAGLAAHADALVLTKGRLYVGNTYPVGAISTVKLPK